MKQISQTDSKKILSSFYSKENMKKVQIKQVDGTGGGDIVVTMTERGGNNSDAECMVVIPKTNQIKFTERAEGFEILVTGDLEQDTLYKLAKSIVFAYDELLHEEIGR